MTETKAETRVSEALPSLPPNEGSAGVVASILAAVVAAIFHFRRKASRDSTEIIKDRAEGRLIEDLQKDREGILRERDTARHSEREAWRQANAHAVENAKLRSDNEYQQREIARLTQMVVDLQQTLDEVKTRLQHLANGVPRESDYGNL